jgi:hypothetical protein
VIPDHPLFIPTFFSPVEGMRKPGFPDGHELAYHSLLVSKISKIAANPVSMHPRANLYSGLQITE